MVHLHYYQGIDNGWTFFLWKQCLFDWNIFTYSHYIFKILLLHLAYLRALLWSDFDPQFQNILLWEEEMNVFFLDHILDITNLLLNV